MHFYSTGKLLGQGLFKTVNLNPNAMPPDITMLSQPPWGVSLELVYANNSATKNEEKTNDSYETGKLGLCYWYTAGTIVSTVHA